LSKVARSGTTGLPPALVQVSLINEAQLGHRLGSLGETDMDPPEDKVDHTLAAQSVATDLICSPSSESDCEYDK
jgi:hypothetical protein